MKATVIVTFVVLSACNADLGDTGSDLGDTGGEIGHPDAQSKKMPTFHGSEECTRAGEKLQSWTFNGEKDVVPSWETFADAGRQCV